MSVYLLEGVFLLVWNFSIYRNILADVSFLLGDLDFMRGDDVDSTILRLLSIKIN